MIKIDRNGKMQTKIESVTLLLVGETKEVLVKEVSVAEKVIAEHIHKNYLLFLTKKLKQKKDENQIEDCLAFFNQKLGNKAFQLLHLDDFSLFKSLKKEKSKSVLALNTKHLLIPQRVSHKNVKKIHVALNPDLTIGAEQNGLINFDIVLDVENPTSDKIYSIFNNYLIA